ncbi:uncharacterized protein OCT59_012517 [Rhizophagus irregularis]|uniref:uncharacterized protein n=1 Tax=Rhizophagus irregularis TaxID=588596 RepID=UPI00331A4A49|nr:hypothetical protein OCT59_012517 [Rhizophagus irregularis]
MNEIRKDHEIYGITQDSETKNYIWDDENQNWKREDQNMFVALKSLNNSKNVTSEFMNEIKLHSRVSGDSDPLNRPTAKEIYEIFDPSQLSYDTELQRQIEKADVINNKLLTENTQTSLELLYKTHSEAIYTSRLLNFNNLPKPKNSDDYYERSDNIISKEFSESLQLRFSQLNINKKESLRRNISQLSTNENESLQINISQLNINESDSLQLNISQLNINENSQNNEAEGKRKKIRLED